MGEDKLMPSRKKSGKPVAVRVGKADMYQHQAGFGPPALVGGEDPAAYEGMRLQISEAVKPQDFIEEIWIRDVVDLTWDSLRMRRLKATLLTSTTSQGLNALLSPLLGFKPAEELSKKWAARDREAVKKVDQQLATMGLNMDAPIAQALAIRIDQFDRLDRMIMNAEGRRNAALREVDRHRSSLAQALRQASDDVIEAEFEDVSPRPAALQDAA
jgi:hypothetical protein